MTSMMKVLMKIEILSLKIEGPKENHRSKMENFKMKRDNN